MVVHGRLNHLIRIATVVTALWHGAGAAQTTGSADVSTCVPVPATTHLDVGGARANLLRLAQLTGDAPPAPLLIRRTADPGAVCAGASGAGALLLPAGQQGGRIQGSLLPVSVRGTFNSAFPEDRNNGAAWAGRGLTTVLTGGVAFRVGPLEGAVTPLAAWQQNDAFEVAVVDAPGDSRWADRGHTGSIDLPQRFGDEAYTVLDPGQSYLRVRSHGAMAGVSTENLWLGPAVRTPLLMSSTAAGIPHVFAGTSRPIDVGIGRLEAQAIWGRLEESDYFDADPENDNQLLAGLFVDFEPAILPGLYLGAARLYLTNLQGTELGVLDYLRVPYTDVRGNPVGDNQLLAIFGRWVHPEAGFEAWAEWGREDHWGAWLDLLKEPDHSQAYVLGVQKVMGTLESGWRLQGELIHLESALPLRGGRGVISFYTHGGDQGLTQRGQLIGAWIGPGSDAQIIAADLLRPWGMVGGYVERVRYDADAYYSMFSTFYGHNGHDVSIGLGMRGLVVRGPFEAMAELGWKRRHNRDFIGLEGGAGNFGSEDNLALDVGLTWRPGLTFAR